MSRFGWVLVMATGCHETPVEAQGDGCPPLFRDGPYGCLFDEDAVNEVAQTFRESDLEKINNEPFLQVVTLGTPILRNVWVSPVPLLDGSRTASDLYRMINPHASDQLDADFPVGTIIVHEAVNGEEGNGIQVRREDTWDDGSGRPWWFAKIFDDGTLDENPCSPCVACHATTVRPGSEGLWGVPREAL